MQHRLFSLILLLCLLMTPGIATADATYYTFQGTVTNVVEGASYTYHYNEGDPVTYVIAIDHDEPGIWSGGEPVGGASRPSLVTGPLFLDPEGRLNQIEFLVLIDDLARQTE